MTRHEMRLSRRRALLGVGAAAALTAATPWRRAGAAVAANAAPAAPIEQLDAALLSAMKADSGTPFAERYRALAPVVEQVFSLDAVLARSVGPSWAALPPAQKATLASAFRRYTVSSYLANFDSYNGQSFQVLPEVRTIGDGQVVVQSRLSRASGSPIALDYVMSRGPEGWRAVDVLTNGTISRVAVQRSDFRALLNSGGVPALTASLEHKVASLSGGMLT